MVDEVDRTGGCGCVIPEQVLGEGQSVSKRVFLSTVPIGLVRKVKHRAQSQ